MVKFCFCCDIYGYDVYGRCCDIYGSLRHLWEAFGHLWEFVIFMGVVIFMGRTGERVYTGSNSSNLSLQVSSEFENTLTSLGSFQACKISILDADKMFIFLLLKRII